MKLDRRDQGAKGEKEWQEFRSVFAAARTFTYLLDELPTISPNYASDLHRRLSEGIAVGEGYLEEDPESDGPAVIPGPEGGQATMMDLSDAILLEDQLFPDRERPDARDLHQATRGMVTAAFHAALESYADALGATQPRTPLPKAVTTFLTVKAPAHQLSSDLSDEFTEFDETRHLIVHNRGIVNDRYIHNVKYTKFQAGEPRTLTREDVHRYARIAWRVARALAAANGTAA